MSIDPAIIQAYSQRTGLSHKEARVKLQANYDSEVNDADFRTLAIRAIKGVRDISPKIGNMDQLVSEMRSTQKELEHFRAEMFKQRAIFKDAVRVFQEYIEEERGKSLFRKIVDHFKCRLSNTKSLKDN